VDEERKINLNYAGKDSLKRLFVKMTDLKDDEADQLASSVIDWRDADNVLYNEEQGLGEKDDYRRSGYAYGPRNSHFASPEELLLVKGMGPDIFLRVRKYVTVFSNGRVNINTASLPVLVSLGLNEELARKVISFRAGMDRTEGTIDDNTFYSADSILETLSGYYPLSAIDVDELTKTVAGGIVDTRSGTFNALCTSELDRGKANGKIVCIFDKSGNIRYWGYREQEKAG
jgi:hypothetical protein